MTDQRVVYALRGEIHVQIVDDKGNMVMDEMVKEGDMFVIPQFYACVARAGSNGFEYIAFKTCGEPRKSPMAGYTSVMRAKPVDVVTNSYNDMSRDEALRVKMSRDPQSMLFSPTRRSMD
ncbi:hypothetical protein P3X46_017784 [Hevea brasiliensis]|uniref:Cupin type-1 domain-containing protein n=1 Tax=Hevea brasiliensis TaxID=3981 RepID=A0ABQ9LRW7_HEVBR|nr:hypothetical protein P3X46_017784 [Hevea brasiliensis]